MFIAGSPPPFLAATKMARQSLLKSLPRFASTAPLRCAMFAEWECPAMIDPFKLLGDVRVNNAAIRRPAAAFGVIRGRRGDEAARSGRRQGASSVTGFG